MGGNGSVLAIIEAAYAPAVDEGAWLAGLVAAGEGVDRGHGVVAATYLVTSRGVTFQSLRGAARQMTNLVYPSFADACFVPNTVCAEYAQRYGTDSLLRAYPRRPHVTTLVRHSGLPPERVHDVLAAGGGTWAERKVDALGVLAGEPSGFGCLLMTTSSEPIGLTPREIRLLTHVAAHLTHGYRLLRGRREAAVDAVLDPGGQLLHAEEGAASGESRAALALAVRRIDRARLRRTAPDEAVALWRGLVSGRWSLVDHVDSDGRRFVFARRNPPDVRAWSSLTEREKQIVAYAAHGHSQKLIAYALGVSRSNVAAHLGSVARKVGARSRVALLAAYRRDHPDAS
jgi:DNA-binding CsgD family transcriptional regulator